MPTIVVVVIVVVVVPGIGRRFVPGDHARPHGSERRVVFRTDDTLHIRADDRFVRLVPIPSGQMLVALPHDAAAGVFEIHVDVEWGDERATVVVASERPRGEEVEPRSIAERNEAVSVDL